MRINNPFVAPLPSIIKEEKKNPGAVNFGELLRDALEKVNLSQLEAEAVSGKLVTGEVEDLHQVIIAVEKAGLSLQLTVQVTNKIVEAYKEITRMQV